MRKTTLLIICTALLAAIGCSRSQDDSDRARKEALRQLPAPVRSLIQAVEENDSATFSSLVAYPLERPYPLRDIRTAAEMKSYYHLVMDDSLRHAITANPAEWHEYGWRGWAPHGGSYIWADDSIYHIPYLSRRETAIRDSLVRLELASLPAALRGKWDPVACYRQADGTSVFRIDKSTSSATPRFRLAIFAAPADMSRRPELVMNGTQEADGTMANITYHFAAPDGLRAIFSPLTPDGSLPGFDFTGPSGSDTTITVVPAHWLDILPPQ